MISINRCGCRTSFHTRQWRPGLRERSHQPVAIVQAIAKTSIRGSPGHSLKVPQTGGDVDRVGCVEQNE
jgi:hypothetical protein